MLMEGQTAHSESAHQDFPRYFQNPPPRSFCTRAQRDPDRDIQGHIPITVKKWQQFNYASKIE